MEPSEPQPQETWANEVAPTPERTRVYPELATLKAAVARGVITPHSPGDESFDMGWAQPEVDTQALAQLWQATERTSGNSDKTSELREKIHPEALRVTLTETLQHLPSELRAALPEVSWGKVDAQPAPRLVFVNEQSFSHYYDHTVLDNERQEIEIRIGGDSLRRSIGRLLELGRQTGVELSDEDALSVAVTYELAHEYGHHIDRAYRNSDQPWEDEYTYVAARDLSLLHRFEGDASAGSAIFAERLAESVAAAAIQAKFAAKPELARLAYQAFLAAKPNRIAEFTNLLEGDRPGALDMADWENVAYAAKRALTEELITDFDPPLWRSIGYYLEPLRNDELRRLFKTAAQRLPS